MWYACLFLYLSRENGDDYDDDDDDGGGVDACV